MKNTVGRKRREGKEAGKQEGFQLFVNEILVISYAKNSSACSRDAIAALLIGSDEKLSMCHNFLASFNLVPPFPLLFPLIRQFTLNFFNQRSVHYEQISHSAFASA